jgi:hypothetical protein
MEKVGGLPVAPSTRKLEPPRNPEAFQRPPAAAHFVGATSVAIRSGAPRRRLCIEQLPRRDVAGRCCGLLRPRSLLHGRTGVSARGGYFVGATSVATVRRCAVLPGCVSSGCSAAMLPAAAAAYRDRGRSYKSEWRLGSGCRQIRTALSLLWFTLESATASRGISFAINAISTTPDLAQPPRHSSHARHDAGKSSWRL